MNKLNLHSIARRRKPHKKVTELGTYHRYDNLLNREFTAARLSCLSTIKDPSDAFIVAQEFGRENSQALVDKTLQKATQNEKVTAELLLHSDQSHQSTSQAYFVLTQQ